MLVSYLAWEMTYLTGHHFQSAGSSARAPPLDPVMPARITGHYPEPAAVLSWREVSESRYAMD